MSQPVKHGVGASVEEILSKTGKDVSRPQLSPDPMHQVPQSPPKQKNPVSGTFEQIKQNLGEVAGQVRTPSEAAGMIHEGYQKLKEKAELVLEQVLPGSEELGIGRAKSSKKPE
jgi:hypothetical protein